MTTLVTGATGLVGRHLVERLAPQGGVRVLARASTDVSELEALGVEIVRGDLRDATALARAVAGCTLVYHLAARTAVERVASRTYREVNVVGTRNVACAAAASGVERLVLSSTVGVYGMTIEDHTITEVTAPRPDSPYGRSKLAAERTLRARGAGEGLPVVIARLASVFGPRARSWLGLFRSVASGRLRLVGGGRNYHHPVDVSDAVEGLLRCGTLDAASGRTYILAGPEPVPLAEMLAVIAEELQAPPPGRSVLPEASLRLYRRFHRLAFPLGLERLPRFDRVEFFLGNRIFDTTLACRELGYEPRIGVRAMIARTAEWFCGQGLLRRGRR